MPLARANSDAAGARPSAGTDVAAGPGGADTRPALAAAPGTRSRRRAWALAPRPPRSGSGFRGSQHIPRSSAASGGAAGTADPPVSSRLRRGPLGAGVPRGLPSDPRDGGCLLRGLAAAPTPALPLASSLRRCPRALLALQPPSAGSAPVPLPGPRGPVATATPTSRRGLSPAGRGRRCPQPLPRPELEGAAEPPGRHDRGRDAAPLPSHRRRRRRDLSPRPLRPRRTPLRHDAGGVAWRHRLPRGARRELWSAPRGGKRPAGPGPTGAFTASRPHSGAGAALGPPR